MHLPPASLTTQPAHPPGHPPCYSVHPHQACLSAHPCPPPHRFGPHPGRSPAGLVPFNNGMAPPAGSRGPFPGAPMPAEDMGRGRKALYKDKSKDHEDPDYRRGVNRWVGGLEAAVLGAAVLLCTAAGLRAGSLGGGILLEVAAGAAMLMERGRLCLRPGCCAAAASGALLLLTASRQCPEPASQAAAASACLLPKPPSCCVRSAHRGASPPPVCAGTRAWATTQATSRSRQVVCTTCQPTVQRCGLAQPSCPHCCLCPCCWTCPPAHLHSCTPAHLHKLMLCHVHRLGTHLALQQLAWHDAWRSTAGGMAQHPMQCSTAQQCTGGHIMQTCHTRKYHKLRC